MAKQPDFQRRHYEFMARALGRALATHEYHASTAIAAAFAKELRGTNAKFDPARFIIAVVREF